MFLTEVTVSNVLNILNVLTESSKNRSNSFCIKFLSELVSSSPSSTTQCVCRDGDSRAVRFTVRGQRDEYGGTKESVICILGRELEANKASLEDHG